VRWHRRIVAAACLCSPWDGSLTCEISLASPWPAELTWTRQWGRDRGWRDWPQLFGQYVPPSEQDLTRSPHLRASLLVQAPVRFDDLPPAPAGPGGEVSRRAQLAGQPGLRPPARCEHEPSGWHGHHGQRPGLALPTGG
jgi:hypothetical protein